SFRAFCLECSATVLMRRNAGRFRAGARGRPHCGRSASVQARVRMRIIGWLIAAAGAIWVVVIWDAFAIGLPRRVTRRLRLTRMFDRVTCQFWSAVARRMRPSERCETYFCFFGPLSLLVLIGVRVASLVVGFALLQSGLGASLNVADGGSFMDYL